jgi:hypothetical protein
MLFNYISDFFAQLNKAHFLLCTLVTALLISCNYYWGWEKQWIYNLPSRPQRVIGFYFVYALAFSLPYFFYWLLIPNFNWSPLLVVIIILAPLVFALKSGMGGWQEAVLAARPGVEGNRLNVLINWPIRLVITVSILLFLFGVLSHYGLDDASIGFSEAMGLRLKGVNWAPYLIMLAFVIPLVSFAATQADFLQTYPKMKLLQLQANPAPTLWQKIAFQLSYGSDFLTIELFFRGFLVVLVARLIGPAAILPMAMFYCSIHFGKPLLECISSYFGGLLLGIFACYSGSIYGGIVVHLGLAWMMELAATIALYWKR